MRLLHQQQQQQPVAEVENYKETTIYVDGAPLAGCTFTVRAGSRVEQRLMPHHLVTMEEGKPKGKPQQIGIIKLDEEPPDFEMKITAIFQPQPIGRRR